MDENQTVLVSSFQQKRILYSEPRKFQKNAYGTFMKIMYASDTVFQAFWLA